MTKTRKKKKVSGPKGVAARLHFVTVRAPAYGAALKGARIYYEGQRPKGLSDTGTIKFGKHILQALRARFRSVRWIIAPKKDSVQKRGRVTVVRTSRLLLSRMDRESWDRTRDIKNDIVKRHLAATFPKHFSSSAVPAYMPGTLADILSGPVLSRISTADREALKVFIPDFVASESVGTATVLSAQSQIKTLKEIADDLDQQLSQDHAESWWQDYIKGKILILQQGYIQALEKLNVSLGVTKFPDFCLVTHDNYLDVLEIKKPNTALVRLDKDRNNFHWELEMTKAISQTENYIEQVATHKNDIRAHLKDHYGLETRVIRPRGIILAGDARTLATPKERADFRLLSQGMKNISVLTYDELLIRVRNYITVLEKFSKPESSQKVRTRKRR